MIVKSLKKEWNVNDCTHGERRILHYLNIDVWIDGKQNVKAYGKLLDEVERISGLDEENFKDMSMTDMDILLQAIFLDYQKVSKKKAGG
mgnify:CR=1 FL=1|tara:strand:+ start:1848 stop:2114 length:267 start_codon:yes stop_codon:yes gene_type:complete